MQFDVVIGNPPYQDSSSAAKNVKLWPKFIKLSIGLLKPGGFISLVTPGSWAVFDSSQSQRQRLSIIDHIDLQQVVDSNCFFNVGVSIVRWLGIKRAYSGNTLAWGVDHDFSAGPYLTDEAKLATAIHEKVKRVESFKFQMGNGNIKSEECKEDTGNLIYFSGSKPRYTSKKVEGVGIGKFVAPFSCSTYSRFYTTEAVGMLNLWMPATEEEATAISAVWDLKAVRFFLDTYQKTAGFCNAVKNSLVPDLRGMDNKQAYAALGLTEEEVAVVEAHCS
jgi:hypothetical protein